MTTDALARIPISQPPWGEDEINEAIDSLRSGMLTMGKKVAAFERMWADYIGVEHAVMTNSGSSANLLALTALNDRIGGGEVITPALTWATTVFPIAQTGAIPVLADVDLATFNLSPAAVEAAITDKTRAIMLVHLLGNPCDMDTIMAIARANKLAVIEDSCEAHGALYHGRKVGSFGHMATFSFFFSHHISTIEGGMVVTNNTELAERCRALRAFGWIRDLKQRDVIAAQNPAVDPRFLFLLPGYNFRPTEIQGAFGIHQVPRLEGFIAQRQENTAYWTKGLAPYSKWLALPKEQMGTRHAWFTYPVMVKPGAPFTRAALQAHLEQRGLETRPIEAGNMAFQPALSEIPHWLSGPLENATYIHNNAFFFGNHAGIGPAEREAVVRYFREFMEKLS